MGSSPISRSYAVIAQLGERVLDVDEVAGSSPAGRMILNLVFSTFVVIFVGDTRFLFLQDIMQDILPFLPGNGL